MIKMMFIKSLIKNGELCYMLTKREIQSRYKGSFLGVGWATLNPIFMLTVYTIVFSQIFKTRWGSESGNSMVFAVNLFAGLIVFNLFSECFNRAPTLLTTNPNYIKKIRFPIEILGVLTVGSSLFQASISVVILIIAMAASGITLQITIFLLPLIMAPMILAVLGLTWILSILGVYFKDIGQLTPVITSALMFLSPIFYPSSALPEKLAWIGIINPLRVAIEETRKVLITGDYPNIHLLVVCWIISICLCEVTYRLTKAKQSELGDYL